MRKLQIIITLVATLISTQLLAQGYEFMVLGVKGNVTIDGSQLGVGSQLKPGQTITISSGGYLGLAHNSGKTTELSSAGTYKVDDLSAGLTGADGDFAAKYAKFVYDELTATDEASRFTKKVKTGSVERSMDDSPIQVMLPKQSFMSSASTIAVKWYPKEDAGVTSNETYVVEVKNLFGDVISEHTTTDMVMNINLDDPIYKKEKAITFTVSVEGKALKSSEKSLKKLKTTEEEALITEISSISSKDDAISALILARYYEEKSMFANAIGAYEAVMDKSEGVDHYKQLYEDFLLRNDFIEKK